MVSITNGTAGEALKRARELAKLSQDSAAEAIGVTRAWISAIECGRKEVPARSLFALAELYGLEVVLRRPRRTGGGE